MSQESGKTRIIQVDTRRWRREFIRLPWRMYAGDPHWIPPIISQQQELLGYKPHPFYLDAEIQTWLAERDGTLVGRIAAVVNRAHNRRFEEQRGFLGFFESIDDQGVADALLRCGCQWLRSRGMTDVRGPANPSLNYEVGMLVDGFDAPPVFMMTYNPPYYGELWESFGFTKTQDLYAFEGDTSMLGSLNPKMKFVIEEVKERFGALVRRVDRRNFRREVELFLEIYNRSLVSTWGFVPLSRAEIEHIGAGLRMLIDPRLTSIIEVDGKPVGAGFGLLDYNSIIKQIDGRLFPFGFLKLLFGRRHIKRVRLISANVLPEYQRWGLGLLALDQMLPGCLEVGITHAEFSWVLESNTLSRASLERGGAKRTKTYRLYDRKLCDI